MESIKDKVAIIGMGCTRFGELWDQDIYDLMVDAAYEASEDAGVDMKDIQAAWIGTRRGINGSWLASALQLQYIPVTRVENACGTGQEAMRGASFALAAKAYDLVLAVGGEKMKDAGYGGTVGGSLDAPNFEKWHPVYQHPGGIGPTAYALAATRYFHQYGLNREEGKRTLAKISVKSHYNGARNPKCHFQREITEEQAMNAPIIAWPLGLFDCCPTTDGAAAAIMCRVEDARKYRDDYVVIKGMGISAGPGAKLRTDYDFTHWEETERAAKQAYEEAGIKNPRKELDMAEIHDCFSIAELIASESLSFCEKGHAKEDIEAGTFTQEGELPVNLGGGLKSFGHPIGASGVREIYEMYKQFQGKVEYPSRQLKNFRLGLAHNQGGCPGKFQCGILIIGGP